MKRIVCALLLMGLLVSGCSSRTEDDVDSSSVENKFEEENNVGDVIKESQGAISYGFLDERTDVYTYDGSEVEIPYYMENLGEESEADAKVGLMLFVNGNIQDFHIAGGQPKPIEKVVLKPGERKEFTMCFKPVSGKKGEKIGVIPVTIWNPDSLPKEDNPIWGNNQELGANVPLEIDMKEDGENKLVGTEEGVSASDIPEEVLEEYKSTYVGDVYDSLDASVNFKIDTGEDGKAVLYAKNGKVDLRLHLFGGKNVRDRITVFINNNPVKIGDKDYIEVNTKKGKMLTVDVKIDVSEYDRNNSLYAIAMTTGADYKVDDVYKTKSMLLINE